MLCPQESCESAGAPRGIWSSLGKLPLRLPMQTAQHIQQQRQQHILGPCKAAADKQQTAGSDPEPQMLPAHVQDSACGAVRCAPEASVADLRRDATRPDQHLQLQQKPMADPNIVSSAQPAGACPQVQFGVFTNLTSGSTFTKPGKLSKAAQQKMQELAASFRQDAMLDQEPEAGFMQPAMNTAHKNQNVVAGPASHADMQQNTHTDVPSRHSSHSDQLASAAQKEAPPISSHDASVEGAVQLNMSAQCQQKHRHADTVDHSSVQPAGSCPQVQFGVFTNLTNGNSFTKPGKLSRSAQQKMQALQAALKQDGMLEDGPASMEQAALGRATQSTAATQELRAPHAVSKQRTDKDIPRRDDMSSNQLSEVPQLQGAADKWADVSAKHGVRPTSPGVHQSGLPSNCTSFAVSAQAM